MTSPLHWILTVQTVCHHSFNSRASVSQQNDMTVHPVHYVTTIAIKWAVSLLVSLYLGSLPADLDTACMLGCAHCCSMPPRMMSRLGKSWWWWQYRWIQPGQWRDGLATQDPGPVRITHNGAHLAPSTMFPFSRVGAHREPLLKIIYMRSTTRVVAPLPVYRCPLAPLPFSPIEPEGVWKNRPAHHELILCAPEGQLFTIPRVPQPSCQLVLPVSSPILGWNKCKTSVSCVRFNPA